MYLETETKNRLLQQIDTFLGKQGKVEWEFAIGRASGYFGEVNRGTFQNLIRRLKAIPNIKEREGQETLDISVATRENIPIRASLSGREDIILFCKENLQVLDNLTFLYKTRSIDGKDTKPVDLTGFGLRSNLKAEIPINLEKPNTDTEAEKARTHYRQLLRKSGGFYKIPKTFRYKRRISYYTEQGFRIDLTVVKTSKTENRVGYAKGQNRSQASTYIYSYTVPAYNIQGADLLNQPETYEVEIECDYEKVRHYFYREVTPMEEGEIESDSEDEDIDSDSDTDKRFTLENTGDHRQILLKGMIETVGLLLQVQQNWVVPTSLDTGKTVLNKYMELVKRVSGETIALRGSDKSNLTQLKLLLQEKIPGNDIFPISSSDSEKKYQASDYLRFVGPKPVSLGLKNVQGVTNIPNINKYYTVTDKADGDGNLLFIDGDGSAYLIDSNLRVRFSGIRCQEEANTLLNGEFISRDINGHINYSFYCYDIYIRQGKAVYDLPLCYPKTWSKVKIGSRLDIMNDCLASINQKLGDTSSQSGIVNIAAKKFYYQGSLEDPETSGSTIYQLSDKCWRQFTSGSSPYKYDGLIYTPMYLPAGYRNSDDYLTLQGFTWVDNLKWKPPDENSIDFLVETEKQTVFQKGPVTVKKDVVKKKNLVNEEGDVDLVNYKILNLFVGGEITEGQGGCESQGRSINIRSHRRHPTTYGKKQFNPPLPAIPGCGTAEVALSQGQLLALEDGNIIADGSVVEFAYNLESTDDFRWIAKRIRYDKTFEYQASRQQQELLYIYLKNLFTAKDKETGRFLRNSSFVGQKLWKKVKTSKNSRLSFVSNREGGYLKGQDVLDVPAYLSLVEKYHQPKTENRDSLFSYLQRNFNATITGPGVIDIGTKYGQNENVANNIWMTIHQPVTTEMITTGQDIPPVAYDDEVYYETSTLETRQKSQTIHLQKYHNFVKRYVLLAPALAFAQQNGHTMTIIDLACGKAGDLLKWKDLGANIVVGTDVARDNIENKTDGACARYQNMVKMAERQDQTHPDCYFFQADSKHDIVSQIKSRDDLASKIFRKLWYEFPEEGEGEGEGDIVYPRFEENRFSVVSLQFALHYFMESSRSLEGILNNINNNLKVGGMLVGSCLDGQRLFQAIQESGQDYIQGEHNGNIIWKITKAYVDQSFPDNDECLGKPVDVYMNSINKTHREYLVNFRYLKYRLSLHPYNLKPLTQQMAESVGLPSSYDPSTGLISFGDLAGDLTSATSDTTVGLTINDKEFSYTKRNLNQMTGAEKTISYLNVGFAFYKSA